MDLRNILWVLIMSFLKRTRRLLIQNLPAIPHQKRSRLHTGVEWISHGMGSMLIGENIHPVPALHLDFLLIFRWVPDFHLYQGFLLKGRARSEEHTSELQSRQYLV